MVSRRTSCAWVVVASAWLALAAGGVFLGQDEAVATLLGEAGETTAVLDEGSLEPVAEEASVEGAAEDEVEATEAEAGAHPTPEISGPVPSVDVGVEPPSTQIPQEAVAVEPAARPAAKAVDVTDQAVRYLQAIKSRLSGDEVRKIERAIEALSGPSTPRSSISPMTPTQMREFQNALSRSSYYGRTTSDPFTRPSQHGVPSLAVREPEDPRMKQIVEAESKMELEARDLAEQYRKATTDREQKALKWKLEKLCNEHFALRQKRRELEVSRLEERLQRVRESIQKRNEARDLIIQIRVSQLLGELELDEWSLPAPTTRPAARLSAPGSRMPTRTTRPAGRLSAPSPGVPAPTTRPAARLSAPSSGVPATPSFRGFSEDRSGSRPPSPPGAAAPARP